MNICMYMYVCMYVCMYVFAAGCVYSALGNLCRHELELGFWDDGLCLW